MKFMFFFFLSPPFLSLSLSPSISFSPSLFLFVSLTHFDAYVHTHLPQDESLLVYRWID